MRKAFRSCPLFGGPHQSASYSSAFVAFANGNSVYMAALTPAKIILLRLQIDVAEPLLSGSSRYQERAPMHTAIEKILKSLLLASHYFNWCAPWRRPEGS